VFSLEGRRYLWGDNIYEKRRGCKAVGSEKMDKSLEGWVPAKKKGNGVSEARSIHGVMGS